MPRGSKSAAINSQFSMPNAHLYSVYRWELGIQNWKLRIIVLLAMTVYL